MAHAHCILDSYGYTQAHTICTIYCLSTATMATRSSSMCETARPVTPAPDNTESRTAVYRITDSCIQNHGQLYTEPDSKCRLNGHVGRHCHLTCECCTWLCLHTHRAVKAASDLPCLLSTTDVTTFLHYVYDKSSCIS